MNFKKVKISVKKGGDGALTPSEIALKNVEINQIDALK